MEQQKIDQLMKHFKSQGVTLVKQEWFVSQVQQNPNIDANSLFSKWIEQDFNTGEVKLNSITCLPSTMLLMNHDTIKATVSGPLVLQINSIVDISHPLPTKDDEAFGGNAARDENDQSDVDEENEPMKLLKRKKSKAPANSNHRNGPRVLLLALGDGHNECRAIEYQPINSLHRGMLGAKLRLVGKMDIYLNTVFLRPKNVQIVSNLTHDLFALRSLLFDKQLHPLQQHQQQPTPTDDIFDLGDISMEDIDCTF